MILYKHYLLLRFIYKYNIITIYIKYYQDLYINKYIIT